MNASTVSYLIVLLLGVAAGMAIEELILEPAREANRAPAVVEAAPREQPRPRFQPDQPLPEPADPEVRGKIERAMIIEANRRARIPQAAQPGKDAPKLEVDEPTFDFGERQAGSKVTHAFVLRNAGTAPLKITRVMPTDGHTRANVGELQIGPGEWAELNVTVELTHQPGRRIRAIFIESNDPTQPRMKLGLIGSAVGDALRGVPAGP